MYKLSRLAQVVGIAVLISAATPVFAESAPVYDADAMPQQMEDSSGEVQQELPPPPAPGQEGVQDGGYAPAVQQQAAPSMSTDQRLRRMEQQINNMQNNDATARVDSLQSQVQSLQGQVEELTHQLQQLQTQLKSQYTDLDKRLSQNPAAAPKLADDAAATPADTIPVITKASRKASAKQGAKAPLAPLAPTITTTADNSTDNSAKASKTPAEAKPAEGQPNVAEEQQIYQTAYNLIKAKKYNEAVTALQGMLQKYPSGQFASNAHYWLGELYVLMSKNDLALNEFSTVVKVYPESPRISDAQLKVGVIYASQSKWSEAKAAFKRVINHYPGTSSARLASEQLKQIKQAGH